MSKIVLTDEASTPATPAAGTTLIYTQGGVLQVLSPSGTPVVPITSAVLTTTGAMIYASAPGVPSGLTIGTAGQFLGVSGGIPAWTTLFTGSNPSALGVSAAPGSSSNAARLDHVHPFPTAANVGAVALSTVTAAGDLIYATASSVVTRRGIGTVGQVLTVNNGATAPEWTNPPTFVAGTTNSTAQYRSATAIQDAITAAAAAIAGGLAAATVEILPGTYTASFAVPENVSLAAPSGFGSVAITGDITINSTAGVNSLSDLYVVGTLTCDAGGASTATVEINTCQFVPTPAAPNPTVRTMNSGWTLNVSQTILDSSAVVGVGSLGFTSGTTATVKNTQIITEATAPSVVGDAVATFDGCTFNRTIEFTTGAGSITLRNCTFDLIAVPSEVFYFAGAFAYSLNILGSFGVNGLAAAGSLYTLAGGATATATVSPGTAIGTYQTANLPVLSASSDGVLAYSSDDNALYVRRSTAWEKVASQSNSNTWNASGGQQTFYTTQFNRAAIPDSVNGGALYNMSDNTSPPLIRMDTAGAKTVNLNFSPALADVGKQWVIFDAARDAGGVGTAITINAVGTTLNGVLNGSATISTNGGALVVRVLAAGVWETLGF